jgi:hypothetical protein
MNDLMSVFESVLSKYPELPVDSAKGMLRQHLEKKKFDVQDGAIIEAVLKDKDKSLEESFRDGLDDHLDRIKAETNLDDYLKSEEGQDKVVEIFLFNLENLINYFYNVLIAKHFAGS